MHFFVTGGAGFIGSHLVEALIAGGNDVTVYDNLSTGRMEFLQAVKDHPRYTFIRGDILDRPSLIQALAGTEFVVHLAANADVRFGTENTARDYEQNTLATYHVLEAMRLQGIKKIALASSGSIYGEPSIFPTPEDAPLPIQTSLYGASKLACEGLLEAYCEGFGFRSWIFRFVSILGERYTHGHIFDFYKKLLEDPNHLAVLGDGRQKKSYLYVGDAIRAILIAVERAQEKVNIFNLGTDEFSEVNDSVRCICEALGLSPKMTYAGGVRGWVGDSPFIFLDCTKIRSLGWKPKLTIREGILKTLEYLRAHQELFIGASTGQLT